MAGTPKGIVYTLTDPRDGAIRYVGKTVKNPLERLAQHLGAPTNPAMRVWLNSLGGQGLLPRMDTIATVAGDKLDAEEDRQIKKHARDGHRLLNSPYYQTNLGDLWTATGQGAEAPAAARDASTLWVAIDALRHRLYGPIAASGLPKWARAGRSLSLAPVLAVGSLALLVAKTRVGRYCLFIGLMGFYAWDIGFDHAIRALVLPHLPVAEALSFWREYLAHPVGLLGLHAAIGCLVVSWASYVDVAESMEKQQRAKAMPASSDLIAARAAEALDAAVPQPAQSPLVAALLGQKAP